mmetsp:Transcript_13576/g.21209  ORF Transcript_13576/g.21209 Transcript_13576/m.21209 type:complete len:89 (+) Transcript_13576:508-774(+)
MCGQALLRTCLFEFDEARDSVQQLTQYTSTHLGSSEIHTVLSPILSALVDSLEARDIADARIIVTELEGMLSPFHVELLLHSLRQSTR